MNSSTVQRRLAAILAADVVEYSRLMGTDEVGTLRTRLQIFCSTAITHLEFPATPALPISD
jgi:class 3 adenylate cyclase